MHPCDAVSPIFRAVRVAVLPAIHSLSCFVLLWRAPSAASTVRDHDITSLAAIISPGFEGASVGICGFLANNAASSKNNHNVTDMTAVESCGGAQSLPRFRLGGFWRTTRRGGRQSALRGAVVANLNRF